MMRAMNIFQILFRQEERVEIYVKSFASGVNLAFFVYHAVKKKYPSLRWTIDIEEGMAKVEELLSKAKKKNVEE